MKPHHGLPSRLAPPHSVRRGFVPHGSLRSPLGCPRSRSLAFAPTSLPSRGRSLRSRLARRRSDRFFGWPRWSGYPIGISGRRRSDGNEPLRQTTPSGVVRRRWTPRRAVVLRGFLPLESVISGAPASYGVFLGCAALRSCHGPVGGRLDAERPGRARGVSGRPGRVRAGRGGGRRERPVHRRHERDGARPRGRGRARGAGGAEHQRGAERGCRVGDG